MVKLSWRNKQTKKHMYFDTFKPLKHVGVKIEATQEAFEHDWFKS